MEWAVADPFAEAGWDDLIVTHPRGTFFHGSAWAKVLRDTYGARPRYWLRRGEFRLRDLLPVMELDSPLTGRRAASLPFTDECSPLLDDETRPQDMLGLLQCEGIQRGWRYWEGRGDWRMTEPSPAFLGHDVALDSRPDSILARFTPATRRAIRKAQHSGLRVKIESSAEPMRVFFDLHCQTRRKHGVPPQPVEFFENIQRHVLARDLGFVAVAWLDRRPVAAAVFLVLGERAFYKFGASATKYLALRGNNLVMWEAMRELSRRGATTLDMGRTSRVNEGLRRFKLGFGAVERDISCCRYDFRTRKFEAYVDRAHGWHNRVFRALPLPVLRLAGRLLYRHLT